MRIRLTGLSATCLLVMGCSADIPRSNVPQTAIVATPAVVEIEPGERPTHCLGCPLMSVEQYLTLSEGQKPWIEGDWVCLEGKVDSSGVLFAAPYVNLIDASGLGIARFETLGSGLDGAIPGKNVVVRGRVSSGGIHYLSEGSFVSQEQITEALESVKRGSVTDSK